ncbi:carboxymuconolactone decarboxylase family protein [Planosporangium mesophilum]|uniref:Carboxymuconolactone decarboxylase n=1 Tax=Planosporangium mesophilum TaxID=689768 RepID=A0A8J3TAQ2_9ACTN|nr:carboxymuconolactone decarboxylase family protein [Planosporangium mesophilum]NJC84128.1 carboxymuconolactone decarboxylase family protein [Planosporangium mesophilum]GII22869.1 carboxymuconolactone decarboxylase [Planosporangium mesophilum]
MPRLPYAADDSETADRMRARRGGTLTPLDRLLLHSPPVADGWNTLLGAIRTESTLPDDIRELVILRVAVINGAEYEWAAHEPLARRGGLGDEHLAVLRSAALRDGGDSGVLSPAQRAAAAYADSMTRDVEVPDPVFDALGEHFDQRQILELTATVGAYNLVSRFLVAMRLTPADRETTAPAAGAPAAEVRA